MRKERRGPFGRWDFVQYNRTVGECIKPPNSACFGDIGIAVQIIMMHFAQAQKTDSDPCNPAMTDQSEDNSFTFFR